MSDANGLIWISMETINSFEEKSAAAIKEFDAIKTEFNRINKDLLATWKGVGADAYKLETDHILEKIGSIKDVLDTMNNDTIKEIKKQIKEFDEQLGENNKNPYEEEGE